MSPVTTTLSHIPDSTGGKRRDIHVQGVLARHIALFRSPRGRVRRPELQRYAGAARPVPASSRRKRHDHTHHQHGRLDAQAHF